MKHTAVNNVYRASRDLFLAQRFARHVSPLTTTVYTHPGDEELFAGIRDLPCYEPGAVRHVTMGTTSFLVKRWNPGEKRFEIVCEPFLDLAQARQRAASERLRNPDARFAVFDLNWNMVEDEAGKLVT
jgi:hypothetical protein